MLHTHDQVISDQLKKSVDIANRIGIDDCTSIRDAYLEVLIPRDLKRSRYSLREAEKVAPNVKGMTLQKTGW